MKGTTLFALMIVGILALAGLCIGVSYAKYDNVTTTVHIDDGIVVTIDDIEVTNGQTITIDKDLGHFRVAVRSDSEQFIGYAGQWSSGPDHVSVNMRDETIKYYGEFTIHFGHGNFSGGLRISYLAPDMLQPITMKFNIGQGVKVTSGNMEIIDGAEVDFTDDATIIVTALDGQKHNINWRYSWSSSCESGSGEGSEYNTSMTFTIENTAYFEHAYGTVNISL